MIQMTRRGKKQTADLSAGFALINGGWTLVEMLGSIAIMAAVLAASFDQTERFIDRRKEQAEAEYIAVASRAMARCVISGGEAACAQRWNQPPYWPVIPSQTAGVVRTPLSGTISFEYLGGQPSARVQYPPGEDSRHADRIAQRAERIARLVGKTVAVDLRTNNRSMVDVSIHSVRRASKDVLVLHRYKVFGDEEYNTMRTHLMMNNHDIKQVQNLSITQELSATSAVFKNLTTSSFTKPTVSGTTIAFPQGLSATFIGASGLLSAASATVNRLYAQIITPTTSGVADTSCDTVGALAFEDGSGKPLWCANWSDGKGKLWRKPQVDVKIYKAASYDTGQIKMFCPDTSWQAIGGGGIVAEPTENSGAGLQGVKLEDVGDWSFTQDESGKKTCTDWSKFPGGPPPGAPCQITADGYPVWHPRWVISNYDSESAPVKFNPSISRTEPSPIDPSMDKRRGWALRGSAAVSKLSGYLICIKTGAGGTQEVIHETANAQGCKTAGVGTDCAF